KRIWYIFRVEFHKTYRKESVAAHAHPYSVLSQLENLSHTRHRHNGTHSDNSRQPFEVKLFKHIRQWVANTQHRIIDHTSQYQSNCNIQHCANNNRPHHSSGQISLWIFTFLRRSRNCIKTDVGKKHCRYTLQNPFESVGCKRIPVGCIYIKNPDSDNQQHYRHLDDNHGITCVSGFFHTFINQPRNQYNDSQSRNICHEMKAEKLRRFCPCLMSILQIEWQIIKRFSRTHQSLSIVKTVVCRQIIHLNPLRQMQSSCFEQPGKIITPRNRQSDISDGIFHNQRPADNPCDNFAKCDIRIRISTSGNRHH